MPDAPNAPKAPRHPARIDRAEPVGEHPAEEHAERPADADHEPEPGADLDRREPVHAAEEGGAPGQRRVAGE